MVIMKLGLRPVFTVVTPTLNCGSLIHRNLESVRAQHLPQGQLEHWVIDGGSSDRTVELLKGRPSVCFVSEKDRGLSDAVNKGLRRASGEWILWLNADDELAPGALGEIQRAMAMFPKARIFCGSQRVFGYDGSLESVTPPNRYDYGDLLDRNTAISQASTFVHHEVYDKVGMIDDSFRYAMDYEWTVRASRAFETIPVDAVLSHYYRRPGSIMDKGIAGQHREFLRVRRMHGRSVLAPIELRLRMYLLMEPLRKVVWLRRVIRRVKECFGHRPLHPIS